MAKKIKVYNQKGEAVKEVEAPAVLEIMPDKDLVSKYVKYLLQKKREAVANTKNRGEVSGGGRKPWRQKGTGNARAGSTRSPLWTGGGVTFGPTNKKSYAVKMNSRERQKALMMIFADKAEKLILVDKLEIKEPKTQKAIEILNKLPVEEGTIIIFSSKDDMAELSFRNLPFVTFISSLNVNALEVLKADQLMFDEETWKKFVTTYQNVK